MSKTKAISVFDKYAHEYDLITNAAQREKYHQREVDAIIERCVPSRVLDAGCATGLTAKLFARRGVEAVGLDRSSAMLKVARARFKNSKLPVSFVRGSFEALPDRMRGAFDLVVCLANSISGVTRKADLRKSLQGFCRVLRPGGHLVLQMLNYEAVAAETLMPIKATRNGDIVYERFSERRGRRLSVYVTRADFSQKPPQYEVFRHDFDNYEPPLVLDEIERAGFGSVRRFGDLMFSRRFSRRSRDLVIVARR